MRRIREYIQLFFAWAPLVGILMVVCALPFHYGAVQRYGLYIGGIGYLADYAINARWRDWSWSRDKWVYLVMALLFFIPVLWQCFDATPATGYYKSQLELRVAFVLIAIIGFGGWRKVTELQRFVGWAVLLTAVGVIIYVGVLLLLGVRNTDLPATFRDQYNGISHWFVGPHMRTNFYCNLALISGFCLLREVRATWQKLCLWAMMLLVMARVGLSDGRSGLLAMLLIVGVCVLVYVYQHAPKWLTFTALAVVLGLSAVVLMQNKRLSAESLQSELRLVIWNYTWTQIKAQPVGGYGISTLSEVYVENAYKDEQMTPYFDFVHSHPDIPESQYHSMAVVNPHNLYLQLFMESGILAPLVFVLMCALAIWFCAPRKRLYMCLAVFLVLWQALFDTFSPYFLPLLIAMTLWVLLLPASYDLPSCQPRK